MLSIGKSAVGNIKAKRKWSHIVTNDIEQLVTACKEIQETRIADKLRQQKKILEQQQLKEIAVLKKNLKFKLKQLAIEI